MKNRKAGYNLIEITVVIAIISLVIGGIYGVSAHMMEKQRQYKAESQLISIIQHMRVAFANHPIAVDGIISAADLASLKIVPTDMIPSGTDSVFGAYGPVTIYAADTAGGGMFSVTMEAVNSAGCIFLLSNNYNSQYRMDNARLESDIVVNGTPLPGPATLQVANAACTQSRNTIVIPLLLR